MTTVDFEPTHTQTQSPSGAVPRQSDVGWWRRWRVPVGLIVLSLVPGLAGSVRLGQLAAGVTVTDKNRRFFDSPLPVVVHVIGIMVFAFAGALQFAPTLRRRGRQWHRRAGYAIVPAGFAVALSGLWMTRFYDLPLSDNDVLGAVRYVVGTWMLVTLFAGVVTLRARQFRAHGAWMARAYGVGLGAGTQVLTNVAWLMVAGDPSPMVRAGLMTAGWVINIVVVEWSLRRRISRARTPPLARA